MRRKTSVLLIGSGRVAKHLEYWNGLLAEPNRLSRWSRGEAPGLLGSLIPEAGIIWLAISDSSIVSFYEEHLKDFKGLTVHFSGALNDSRLASAHPLMSFPAAVFAPEVYPRIHFALNGLTKLESALPGFTNSFTCLSAEEKSYYHALCVLAGNFPQLLWNQVAREMQGLNIPSGALDVYIHQVAANYVQLKEKSLTGPLVRGDLKTIRQNLASLEKTEKLQRLYAAFTKEFSP